MEKKVFIKVTDSCNLNCSYCDFKPTKEKLSLEMAEKIKNFIKNTGEEFDTMVFTGGEPFLNPEAMLYFAEQFPNFRMRLITNGTVLNDKVKDFLDKYGDRLQIILSFDGKKTTQDKQRFNSYDRVMKNLPFFKEFITSVNTVVTPESIFNLHKNLKFIKENIHKKYTVIIANGIEWKEELDWDKFEKYFKENCLGFSHMRETLELRDRELCQCGDYLMFDLNGDIYPCSNFLEEKNKFGDIENGINHNKRRPFFIARKRGFETDYVCLLKNREENGSIFNEKDVHPDFFDRYLNLIELVKEK